jgi:hypothetical protein
VQRVPALVDLRPDPEPGPDRRRGDEAHDGDEAGERPPSQLAVM